MIPPRMRRLSGAACVALLAVACGGSPPPRESAPAPQAPSTPRRAGRAPVRLRRNRRQRRRRRSRGRHGRRADRGREAAARHPPVARRQAAAGGAVRFADRRPRRGRVQAAAARSRRRRHRRGRSRRRTSWCAPTTADRIPNRSTSRPTARKVYVSNEDAAEMSVLDLTTRARSSRASRWARSPRR